MRRTITWLFVWLAVVGLTLGFGATPAERARRTADAVSLSAHPAHAHPVGEVAAPHAPGRLVIDLADDCDDALRADVARRLGVDVVWLHPEARDEALAVAEVADLAAAMALLAGVAGVEVAEPSLQVNALGFPNDPLFERQWHLRQMGAPSGWARSPAGAGVVVAVLDTGVSVVEDLDAARVLPGQSFVPGVTSWQDDNGHGTHVAGTIAQTTDNGLGVAGVAYRAQILPVKVLAGAGGGTSEQVAAGIDWAVDHGAQIINLSLGSGQYSEVVHLAAVKARAQGVLIVAAAGNDGRQNVSWPGALEEVIGVAAIGPDGGVAPYSNRGPGVDIAAPGGDKRRAGGGVWQDTVDGAGGHAYRELQGTSMAAPHVSGAAAVLWSTGVVDATEVERVLLAGADGSAWTPERGWGALDLDASLDLLGGEATGTRAALGLVFAWLLCSMAGAGPVFRGAAMASGALAAGGLPFLATYAGFGGAWLSRGLLDWPVVWWGPTWGAAVMWGAVCLPLAAALLLGPLRPVRPIALGVCAGVAAHLVHGLAVGAFGVWWVPSPVVTSWFALQALVSLLAAMVVAGVERLDARERGATS